VNPSQALRNKAMPNDKKDISVLQDGTTRKRLNVYIVAPLKFWRWLHILRTLRIAFLLRGTEGRVKKVISLKPSTREPRTQRAECSWTTPKTLTRRGERVRARCSSLLARPRVSHLTATWHRPLAKPHRRQVKN
jgi:hypothetical protein